MKAERYYELLFDGIPADTGLTVSRVVRGVSWTAAVLSDGRCGVGMRTVGESAARLFPALVGLPLHEAARALLSWNFEEASEGMAVVNAWYNTLEQAKALGCHYTNSALDGIELSGRTIGFVGHLVKHSGITEELLAPAKAWYIMEREPKPGDYPDTACEYLLPACDLVVVTGSAAINKTLPRILALSRSAELVLTGPSVTLCPAVAEAYNIRRLNMQVVTEPEAMLADIVKERRSINAFSKHYTYDAALV